MKKPILFFALSILIGCADSPPKMSLEIEYLDSDAIQSWVGIDRGKLTDVWGEPSDTKHSPAKLTYLVKGKGFDKALLNAGSKDLQAGAKTNGIDNDTVNLLRVTMANSCTAVFTVDSTHIIVKAQLYRFKGAKECDASNIYSSGAMHNDT